MERTDRGRRRLIRSALLLAVTGLSIYLLLPSIVSVFSSWRSLRDVEWPFVILMLLLETASYVCLWEVDRIALGWDGWLSVACAQLAGNALGRIVPGSATPFSVSLLRDAGLDTGRAAAGLTTSTLLQIATALALPVLSVPALIAGAPVDRSLAMATYIGVAALVVLLVVGAIVLRSDSLLRWVGNAVEKVVGMLTRRRVSGLADKVLHDRDFVRSTLDRRWRAALAAAVGNTSFDYLALLSALRAVGADPRPSLVVLAYASAEVLALIPLTPGGLGFVEAGLVGTLTLAGVPAPHALTATLLYRLVSYWLPIPLGGVAYVVFRRRFPAPAEPATPRDPVPDETGDSGAPPMG
jgi:uncharacterized protein (TIRG00374 family)